MFDPETLICDLAIPVGFNKKISFGTLWHKDPCTDGSDNSCGWPYCKLTENELLEIKKLARCDRYVLTSIKEDKISILGTAYFIWKGIAHNFYKETNKVSIFNAYKHISDLNYLILLTSNPFDNIIYSLKNIKTEEDLEKVYVLMLKLFKTHRRKWWQHPKWHFKHWKFYVKFPILSNNKIL